MGRQALFAVDPEQLMHAAAMFPVISPCRAGKDDPLDSQYRQVRVPGWPADVHYEFRKGRRIGTELHLEDSRLREVLLPLAGFGPYAEVLEGLYYVANERGLLPDPRIGEWIVMTAEREARLAGWLETK